MAESEQYKRTLKGWLLFAGLFLATLPLFFFVLLKIWTFSEVSITHPGLVSVRVADYVTAAVLLNAPFLAIFTRKSRKWSRRAACAMGAALCVSGLLLSGAIQVPVASHLEFEITTEDGATVGYRIPRRYRPHQYGEGDQQQISVTVCASDEAPAASHFLRCEDRSLGLRRFDMPRSGTFTGRWIENPDKIEEIRSMIEEWKIPADQ